MFVINWQLFLLLQFEKVFNYYGKEISKDLDFLEQSSMDQTI